MRGGTSIKGPEIGGKKITWCRERKHFTRGYEDLWFFEEHYHNAGADWFYLSVSKNSGKTSASGVTLSFWSLGPCEGRWCKEHENYRPYVWLLRTLCKLLALLMVSHSKVVMS